MNTFTAYECPNRFFKDESLLQLIASFMTTIKVSGIYHQSVDDLRLSSSTGPRYPYIIGLVARHMYNGISNTTYWPGARSRNGVDDADQEGSVWTTPRIHWSSLRGCSWWSLRILSLSLFRAIKIRRILWCIVRNEMGIGSGVIKKLFVQEWMWAIIHHYCIRICSLS